MQAGADVTITDQHGYNVVELAEYYTNQAYDELEVTNRLRECCTNYEANIAAIPAGLTAQTSSEYYAADGAVIPEEWTTQGWTSEGLVKHYQDLATIRANIEGGWTVEQSEEYYKKSLEECGEKAVNRQVILERVNGDETLQGDLYEPDIYIQTSSQTTTTEISEEGRDEDYNPGYEADSDDTITPPRSVSSATAENLTTSNPQNRHGLIEKKWFFRVG